MPYPIRAQNTFPFKKKHVFYWKILQQAPKKYPSNRCPLPSAPMPPSVPPARTAENLALPAHGSIVQANSKKVLYDFTCLVSTRPGFMLVWLTKVTP